jgi:tetratricopeptide (TPR) repeat protein
VRHPVPQTTRSKEVTMRRTLVVALLLLAPAVPARAQRIRLPVKLPDLEVQVQKDSDDAAAHYNVALAYWNEKRYDDAERALRNSVTIEPSFAPGYLALALLPYARRPKLWQEEDRADRPKEILPILEEADRNYRRAFLVDPLVDVRLFGAVTPPKDVFWEISDAGAEFYQLVQQGFDDFNEGHYDLAFGRLTRLMEEIGADRHSDRGRWSIWYYHALSAAHVGKFDVAINDLNVLLQRSLSVEAKDSVLHIPLRTSEWRYLLGSMHQRAGRVNEALVLYRQALEGDIGLFEAHVQMASIFEAARDYPRAIEERQRAVNTNPDDAGLLLDLGVTLGKSGKFGEAEATLLQAATANPRDPRIPFWLAIAQEQLNKKAEAKASYARFLAIAPSRFEKQITMAQQKIASLQ